MKIDEISCPTCAPFKVTQMRPRSYRVDETQTSINEQRPKADITTDKSFKKPTDTDRRDKVEETCPYCAATDFDEDCKPHTLYEHAKETKDDQSTSIPPSEPPPTEECPPNEPDCLRTKGRDEGHKPFRFTTPADLLLPKAKSRVTRRGLPRAAKDKKTPVKQPTPKDRTPPKDAKSDQFKQLETEGDVFVLRRKRQPDNIDWKKKPRYQVKQTATSKLRYNYWFADCGRQKVKAYRGDWSQFPPELMKDWEVYQNYFKYRRQTLERRKSIVRKIVRGELTPGGGRRTKRGRIFAKRSPMALAGRPSARTGRGGVAVARKKRAGRRVGVGYLRARGARFDLGKEPLIAVRGTVTSQIRSKTQREPCGKPQTSTFWHGSTEELKDLKRRITARRRQLKEYWKSVMQTGKAVASARGKTASQSSTYADKMSAYMVVSMRRNSKDENDTSGEDLTDVKKTEKSLEMGANTEAVHAEKSTPKVETASSYSLKIREPVTTPRFPTLRHVAKWMLPPTIPIQQSLTSAMRRKLKNNVR